MNKTIYSMSFLLIAFIFAGCQELQQGDPADVSYVPIDQINVDELDESDAMEEVHDEAMEDAMEELDESDVMEDEAMEVDVAEETTLDDILEELDESDAMEEEVVEDAMEELDEDETEDAMEDAMEEVHEETMEEEAREIVILVEETELVELRPVAIDPDDDNLQFTYSSPLDSDGAWQTTYGDMGEYTITITASDGELTSSRDALLIVAKKEEEPTVDSMIPEDIEQDIMENTELAFSVEASDLNDDPITFEWKLDGEVVSITDSYTYEADFASAGSHTVKLDISDETSIVTVLWSVTVENVDRAPVLSVIPDMTIKETEVLTISPEASDPDGDEIEFMLSDPVGDDGVWETTHDDSGVYTITVTATDGELDDQQDVKITVVNVNRAPVIEDIIQLE